MSHSPHHRVRRFNLLRWFSIFSFVLIVVGAGGTAAILSQFLTDTLLQREAEVMEQFVNSALHVKEIDPGFAGANGEDPRGDVAAFLAYLGNMPGVLRTNVYLPDQTVAWSSDAQLIGKQFSSNADVGLAFRGKPSIRMGHAGSREKKEHMFLKSLGALFTESYLPLWSDPVDRRQVVAVVEVYRSPKQLFAAIADGRRLIWLSSAAAGGLLFAGLFWIVHRADRIMLRQEEQLVEAETLAAVGEMASAVAHGLRNPLASVRSSAELALQSGPEPEVAGCLRDIIVHADRLGVWVRQYLGGGGAEVGGAKIADVRAAIAASVHCFTTELGRRHTRLNTEVAADLPPVGIDPMIVIQVLSGLIANAIEATADGGRLSIRARAERGGTVLVSVEDDGPGMTPAEMEAAFAPFTTSKRGGLGLGLPLARRILERHGGGLALTAGDAGGIIARAWFPVARAQ